MSYDIAMQSYSKQVMNKIPLRYATLTLICYFIHPYTCLYVNLVEKSFFIEIDVFNPRAVVALCSKYHKSCINETNTECIIHKISKMSETNVNIR